MKVLLSMDGIDLNKARADGVTPLIIAVYKGRKAVVTALLKAGADQAVRDDDGKTAREWAEQEKHGWGDAFWQ